MDMTTKMDTSQVKAPRLCIMKREDDGYGFNLHGEKGVTGQYISAVDSGGAADKAGLRYGDRVVEVNGINVENQKHSEVVQHIRLHPTHAALLVVDPITDKYLRSLGKSVSSDMIALASVVELDSSITQNNDDDHDTDLPNELVEDRDASEHSYPLEDMSMEEALSGDVTPGLSDQDRNDGIVPDQSYGGSGEEKGNEAEEDYGGEEGEENPYDYVTQYAKEEPCVESEEKPSLLESKEEKSEETSSHEEIGNVTSGKQLPGNLTLNISSQNTEESNSNLSKSSEEPFKKVPPKVAPRPPPKRKDIKQGDWRAKKELFDKL